MRRILRALGIVGAVVFSLATPARVMSQTTLSVGSDPEAVAIDTLANRAVISHKDSQDLWIIDLSTQTAISSISLSSRPGKIAIDSATGTALVILEKLDSILIIDLATHMQLATIPVGRSPEGIAIDSLTQQAVVTNEKDDTVSIIDLTTQSVIATLPVGKKPKGVAIHPGTLVAVVANEKEDSLSFIDLTTRNLIATLAVPEKPQDVAINPVSNQAVITHEKGDQISLIDLTTQSLMTTLPVGRSPNAVVINPNTQQALVSNEKDDSLTLVDLATATVLGHLSVGKNPEGIDIHPETNLVVVANKKDDTITLIDLNTAILTTPVPVGKDPRGVGIETDTDLAVVANKKNNTLSLLNLPDGSLVVTLSVGKDPEGVAVDSLSNKALVTNRKENTLSIIDLTTQSVVATLLVGKDPHGVAINPNTHLAVVANKKDDTLSIFDLTTRSLIATLPVGKDPIGIVIHPSTLEAFVANHHDNTVSVIDLSTLSITDTLPVGKRPREIAVHPGLNLVIVTNEGDDSVSILQLGTPPTITGFSPTQGPSGTVVTLTGENFDTVPADNSVFFFNNAPATVLSATATSLTVTAPAGAVTGPITVTTPNGTVTSTQNFIVGSPGPTLTSINPSTGKIGTPVTITGLNFDPTPSNNTVTFNGKTAIITSATLTQITSTVPQGATTGPITVTTPIATATSSTLFTVALSGDFSLNLLPGTANLVAGSYRFISVGATGINGFTDWINLSTDPLPTGISMLFSPPQVTPDGLASVEIVVAASTPPGIYPITFRGSAQIDGKIITRTASFFLEILGGGATTLSGRVFNTNNNPVPEATISLGTISTTTDASGQFFLENVPTGQQIILVDGRTAIAPTSFYPKVEVVAEVTAGSGNVLPFIIYLPEIDTAHPINLPVDASGTTTAAVTATTPLVPGLEVNIPSGTQIIDPDGNPVSQITITPVPPDRAPMPLPNGVDVPLLFTIQPGGSTLSKPVPITFPNLKNDPPGERANFYFFDVTTQDWAIYGQGTVSPDGRQVVPDPGVGIPRFAWHFTGPIILILVPGLTPTPDGPPPTANDPVDMSTGLFKFSKTDMVIPGRMPIVLTRYYHSGKTSVGPFGVGTGYNFGPRLNFVGSGTGQLVLTQGDDGRMPFSINSDGTYTNSTNISMAGAKITIQFGERILQFKDGVRWTFNSNGVLLRQEDRNGNVLTFDFFSVGEENGRRLTFTYSGGLITQVTDPIGRIVQYAYDASQRLISVTDPAGGMTVYGYDTQNRMITLTDARGITFLQNTYDVNNRVTQQVNADGGVFRFQYFGPNGVANFSERRLLPLSNNCTGGVAGGGVFITINAGDPIPVRRACQVVTVVTPGPALSLVTQSLAIDPEGHITSYRFNGQGYLIEETSPDGAVTRHERAIGTNELLSTTDPLGRKRIFTYDDANNITTVTDADGNVTAFTYTPTFNRIDSITDALGQVTSFSYDSKGNLLTTSDPSDAVTQITYNAEGQPVTVTNPLGNVTRFNYDADGNLQPPPIRWGMRHRGHTMPSPGS